MNYTPGSKVYWLTGDCSATVVRESTSGEVVIQPTVGLLPITTRGCFLIPIAS